MQKILLTDMGFLVCDEWATWIVQDVDLVDAQQYGMTSGNRIKKDRAFIMATAKRSITVKECPVWVELNNVSAPGAAITSLCELLHMSRPLVLQQLTHTVGSLIRVLVSESLWISAPGVSACQFLLSVQLRWANEEWQFPSLDSVAIPHFLKGIQID